MSTRIDTELGKIYYKWSDTIEDFVALRVIDVFTRDNKTMYKICNLKLDDIGQYQSFSVRSGFDKHIYTESEYREMKAEKGLNLLKSDGIISLSNLVLSKIPNTPDVCDVAAIFFANTKETGYPNLEKPYVIARQAFDNLYSETKKVGLSVNINSLPTGYSISHFLVNESVLSSRLCHVYKTDNINSLSQLLENNESDKILKDLFDKRYHYHLNTERTFIDEIKHKKKSELSPLDGYNWTIKEFLLNTGFIDDVYNTIGITRVDFEIKDQTSLDIDDIRLLSLLHGGVRICKALPLRFGYDIDLDNIKMPYFLVLDSNDILWIVPYTKYPDEISAAEIYKVTNDVTSQLHERLCKCIKAYYGQQ